jgi:hypothetical protein
LIICKKISNTPFAISKFLTVDLDHVLVKRVLTELQLFCSMRREEGMRLPFMRPHGKLPTHWQKEHPGGGPEPVLSCSLPRWLWILIPSRPRMQSSSCWFLLTATESDLQVIMPHRCTARDPRDYLQRSLKDPIPYECRALPLLFYSIRCVFFCSLQA